MYFDISRMFLVTYFLLFTFLLYYLFTLLLFYFLYISMQN